MGFVEAGGMLVPLLGALDGAHSAWWMKSLHNRSPSNGFTCQSMCDKCHVHGDECRDDEIRREIDNANRLSKRFKCASCTLSFR